MDVNLPIKIRAQRSCAFPTALHVTMARLVACPSLGLFQRQGAGVHSRMLLLAAATVVTFALFGVVSGDEWGANACDITGTCGELRTQYATLVSGTECNSVYIRGVCTRVCLNSLRALQARHSWTGCARRCAWPDAVVAAAADWTAFCAARAEPEVPPEPEVPVGGTAHNATTESGKSQRLKVHGSFGASLGKLLVGIMCTAALVVVASRHPRTRLILLKITSGKFRSGASRARSSTGILGGKQERSELRRILDGGRKHLKAMRKNID